MPTVVIADDSPTLRRIVTTVLEREGFTVVPAEDGVEAVQAVFRTQPDAVILDVQMPRVSGYVAARLLKDDWQTADIPVILLTSLDAASDRYWGAQTGADRFLTKDFEAPQLVAGRDRGDRGGRGRARRPAGAAPGPGRARRRRRARRVCDLLDRKLFEASVAAEVTGIAGDRAGLRGDRRRVLGVLGRIVDYDLAGVLLARRARRLLTVARETSHAQYAEFLSARRCAGRGDRYVDRRSRR